MSFVLPILLTLLFTTEPPAASAPASSPTIRQAVDSLLPASAPAQLRDQAKAWRDRLQQKRRDVIPQMKQTLIDRNDQLRTRLLAALDDAGKNAFLFLALLPLPLAWRYYRRFGRLVLYCLLSAVLCYGAMWLYKFPLKFLQLTTGHLSEEINPRLLIADETCVVMNQHLERYQHGRRDPLAVPLEKLLNSPLDLATGTLFSNLQWLDQELWVFDWLEDLYRQLDWLLTQLPLLLLLAGTVFFAVSARGVFAQIALLPLHAVEGEKKPGRQLLKLTFKNWLEEMGAVLPVIALLYGLAVLSAQLLGHSLRETVETMFYYTMATIGYLTAETSPSSVLLFVTLLSVWVVLLFNLAVVFLADMFYIAGAMTILRRVCHQRVSLREGSRFWLYGSFALVWVQLLPAGFFMLSFEASERIFRHYLARSPADYATPMLLSAILLVAGLVLAFWLLRGFQAMWILMRPLVWPAAVPPG